MTLREVLHAHIPTLTKKSTVRDAVDKMDIYQFSALVFVGENSEPIAVITEGDLCQAVHQSENLTSIANEPAINFASLDPTCAPVDMEISDALHLMLNSGLTLLPVVCSERLFGVVLRVDLMQAMLLDVAPV